MNVVLLNGGTPDHVGMIPHWLDESDMRNAREQLDEHYQHGGGWRPQPGFKLDPKTKRVEYPGDPPFVPLALMRFRDETLIMYQYSYLLILQKDGTFEICRMD